MSHDYLLQVRLWWPREGGPGPQWLPENIQKLFDQGQGIELEMQVKGLVPQVGGSVRLGRADKLFISSQRLLLSEEIPQIHQFARDVHMQEIVLSIGEVKAEGFKGLPTAKCFLQLENAEEGEKLLKELLLSFCFKFEYALF